MRGDATWLAPLYGAAAPAVAQRVAELVDRTRSERSGSSQALRRAALGLTNALLITYADQVRRAGEPPLQTLTRFCTRHLRGAFGGIHLLPFYPSSSDDGFSVKDFFAVDPAFGSWEDIRRLAEDFDLMFDAVFNHVSAQGSWFKQFLAGTPRYRDFFITVSGQPDLSCVVRPRALPLLTAFATAAGTKRVWTTFSADQVDLNYRNPEVLLAALEALLFYVARGARYIRLDAVAFLWKEIGTSCLHLPQTHRLIQFLRAVLDDVAPGVRLITETNVPHADNVTYFGDGASEAHLVYNFALPPLVLHSFASGNAEALTRWAQSLTLPSPQVAFFNFLASHDGIGLNPVRGILTEADIDALVVRTRAHGGFISDKHLPDGSRVPYELNINFLDGLSDPSGSDTPDLAARRLLTAHAILLSLPGLPGIYFHSLVGSRGDRKGAEFSGIPRRINREKLDADRLETELTSPGSLRAQAFSGIRSLLATRGAHPALAPEAAHTVLALDPRVFAIRREAVAAGKGLLCLHNVSPEPVRLSRSEAVAGEVTLAPHGWCWLET